jgi:CheY-like chemotaxis protein
MTSPAAKSTSPVLPVLLIEDEPAVMAYVRAALERSNYSVVCTESGVEALHLLEHGKFLGVVSDMRTPGGVDGGDVHAWIAENRPELASRLVFITGDIANEETVATLRKTGAPCVEKPFRVRQFISVIEKTMGKAQ